LIQNSQPQDGVTVESHYLATSFIRIIYPHQ